MGIKNYVKSAGESSMEFARRIVFGKGVEVNFPSAQQLAEAQAFLDAAAKSAGPNRDQQALLRRLANHLPDTSAVKSVSVVQPIIQDQAPDADALLRYKLSQVL